MRSTRQRSSDHSKSDESYEDEAPVESETVDATQPELPLDHDAEKEDSKLNANAADFIITPKQQLFEEQSQSQQQQPQISFIAAMPSPQPAPPQRQGTEGERLLAFIAFQAIVQVEFRCSDFSKIPQFLGQKIAPNFST